MAEELHAHQGLVNVAPAHVLGDLVPQALVGGGGGWGHGRAWRQPDAARAVLVGDGTGGGTEEEKPYASCHALHLPLPHASKLADESMPDLRQLPGFRNRLKLVSL